MIYDAFGWSAQLARPGIIPPKRGRFERPSRVSISKASDRLERVGTPPVESACRGMGDKIMRKETTCPPGQLSKGFKDDAAHTHEIPRGEVLVVGHRVGCVSMDQPRHKFR